jgi:hypothetical protein
MLNPDAGLRENFTAAPAELGGRDGGVLRAAASVGAADCEAEGEEGQGQACPVGGGRAGTSLPGNRQGGRHADRGGRQGLGSLWAPDAEGAGAASLYTGRPLRRIMQIV